jgi:hypothetical protein
MAIFGGVWCRSSPLPTGFWRLLVAPVPALVWCFPGKFIPLHRQNNKFGMTDERIQELATELDVLCLEWKRREIVTLQMEVEKWANRFNSWPRILRPVCLRNFKKWAARYNAVVCFVYPSAPGAPLPVEELFNEIV